MKKSKFLSLLACVGFIAFCALDLFSQERSFAINAGVSVATGGLGGGLEVFGAKQLSLFAGVGIMFDARNETFTGWGVGFKYYLRKKGKGGYLGAGYSPVASQTHSIGGAVVEKKIFNGPTAILGYKFLLGKSVGLTVGLGISYIPGLSDFWKNRGVSEITWIPDLTIGISL